MTYRTDAGRGALRSPHALEIPFVFDNIENCRRFVGAGDEPQSMAELMSTTWIAFARSGGPNNAVIPQWNPYKSETRETMIFDPDCRVEQDFGKLERQVWQDFYYAENNVQRIANL